MLNRQWVLARRPTGHICPDDFAYQEEAFEPAPLKPGEILLKSRVFRFAPAMRTWIKATSQFVPPMPLDRPVTGSCSAEVLASENPAYPVGAIVSAMTGWQDYAVVDPAKLRTPPRIKPAGVSIEDFESLLGGNSLTAYFGLLRIGEPNPGETVLVSGAAGSTGAMAAQIGKIVGCKVVGIAGGRDKCDWLVEACGLDAAIDYKAENVERRLGELCPEGVNVFFDNVGGAILDAAIEHMAPFGRVALCGQIGSYDEGDALAAGPRNMMRVIYWRLKLQGFLMFDFADETAQAEADLRRWSEEGRLMHKVDLHHGFDQLPATFMRLFDGSNFGTLLLTND